MTIKIKPNKYTYVLAPTVADENQKCAASQLFCRKDDPTPGDYYKEMIGRSGKSLKGMSVTIDMSTCENTAFDRVFGVLSGQFNDENTLIAELESINYKHNTVENMLNLLRESAEHMSNCSCNAQKLITRIEELIEELIEEVNQ